MFGRVLSLAGHPGQDPRGVKRAFDRRLGDDFLAAVPHAPGVYRVHDEAGAVVYVGKAVDLRRRLSQYRLASRRKKHRKMREIVKSAASITFEPLASPLEAELREQALIQELSPRWNVAGAFSFLYPMIGVGERAGRVVLAISTVPEERPELTWHGAYRSRELTGDAYRALTRLWGRLGHRERVAPRAKGTRTRSVELRQLPREWCASWAPFFLGESKAPLTKLLLALLERPGARRDRELVQEDLDALDLFYRREAQALAEARRAIGERAWPIAQHARDALFIRARAAR